MHRIYRSLELTRHKFLNLENVVGVGVGYKEVAHRSTPKKAILVLVEKKIPSSFLAKDQIIPERIGSIETDVVEIGPVQFLTPRTDQVRPAQPGLSIGHYAVTAGTLGALVRDRKTRKMLLLSNNHVLANATNGRDGRSKAGDAIYQPAPYDGGTAKDTVARLERFVPLWATHEKANCPFANAFGRMMNGLLKVVKPNYQIIIEKKTTEENLVDAALACPIEEDLFLEEVLDIGVIQGTATPEIGMAVQKSGRTTGLTSGTIKAINVTLAVGMAKGATFVFTDQILTELPSQTGDSGALVVDQQHRAVGLMFAGSPKYTIVNRIENIINLLQVELP